MTPDPEDTATVPEVTEDTAVMPAVPETEILEPLPESAPEPAEAPDGPCRCGTCDAAPEPGKDALLYYGPGIATRMWETRIRNGQWEDINAEFNAAHARIHLPALKRNGEIRLDLSTGTRNLAAVFGARPETLADERLAERLAEAEAEAERELERQQTYMYWETQRRIAALRSDLTEDETEETAAA